MERLLPRDHPRYHLEVVTNLNDCDSCCEAVESSDLPILYLDAEWNVVFGILPNLRVKRCGCKRMEDERLKKEGLMKLDRRSTRTPRLAVRLPEPPSTDE